jgi:hypothetical protein
VAPVGPALADEVRRESLEHVVERDADGGDRVGIDLWGAKNSMPPENSPIWRQDTNFGTPHRRHRSDRTLATDPEGKHPLAPQPSAQP